MHVKCQTFDEFNLLVLGGSHKILVFSFKIFPIPVLPICFGEVNCDLVLIYQKENMNCTN